MTDNIPTIDGFYWVKQKKINQWSVVEVEDEWFYITGNDWEFRIDDPNFTWGPKIEEPRDDR